MDDRDSKSRRSKELSEVVFHPGLSASGRERRNAAEAAVAVTV